MSLSASICDECKMAATTNGNGNLVDEFEEAFQACLHVISKDGLANMDRDAVRAEAEQTVSRMMDIARQLEAFFLQKRFLLSALKPELIVREDCIDLRHELARKDELIKRHHEKIAMWQSLLSDMQAAQQPRGMNQVQAGPGPQQGPNMNPNMAQPNGTLHGPGGPGTPSNPNVQGVPGMQGMPGPVQGMSGIPGPNAMPGNLQQLQQQHQIQMQMQQQMQHQQMQQQMQMQQQVSGMAGGMVSPQQAMFMQQQGMGMPPRGPSFPSQGPGGALQGPLAYLEKTTSNIGMPDGRR